MLLASNAMAQALPCLIVPLVIGVIITIMVLAARAARQRQLELEALARELGLAFDPSSVPRFDKNWPRFECFSRGHSRRAFNLLSGALPEATHAGGRCLLGDYEFKETHSNGKTTQTVTYRFSFLILMTRWGETPDVLIRRENFLDKIAGLLGFDDIDFESAEFSRKFMVKSSDKRFAYDLIDPQMMEFLLLDGTPNIDVGGGAVCFWYGQNKRLDPAGLRSLFAWGTDFLHRWPRVVVAQLDGK
ncbi:MAG: hypothetical protein U0572_04605 [Phycisphaerales bacterium]